MALLNVVIFFGLFVDLFGLGECSISCLFDESDCGWTVNGTSRFHWRAIAGSTPDRTSGPLNDVTCKNFNGHYMYLPGMYSRKNETASLESEAVTLTNQTWLSFWYHMNGDGIGSMKILQRFVNGSESVIWSKTGEQNQDWQKDRVTVNKGTFQLRILGSVRLPTGSDVAIDDVILESETIDFNTSYCSRTTPKPTVPTTLSSSSSSARPTTRVQPTSPARPSRTSPPYTNTPILPPVGSAECVNIATTTTTHLPGTCDFENGQCGLTIIADKGDRHVTWMVSNKRDYPNDAAPILWDHTFGDSRHHGFYLNFQNSWAFLSKNPDGKNAASLETPLLNDTNVCLSFWHIMVTKNANLLVYVKDADGNKTDVWRSETKTPLWTNVALHIKHEPPFKIGFQSRNKEYYAKLALDDIVITPGPNLPITSTSSVSLTTIMTTPANINTTVTPVGTPDKTSIPPSSTASNVRTVISVATSKQPSRPTILSETTHKTKKPIETTTKKDAVSGKGKNEKQAHSRFRNSSTVVGFSVGGLILVTAVAVAIYFVRQSLRNKRFAKRQRNIRKTMENGLSNEGFASLGNNKVDEKTVTRNGHALNGIKQSEKMSKLSTGTEMNGGYANIGGLPSGTMINGGKTSGSAPLLDSNQSFVHSKSVNDSNVITRF